MGVFKGTKGKWERVSLEPTEFYAGRNEIHFGEDGECVAEFVANDYDAKLIASAPEMLEMLKLCKEKLRTVQSPSTSCYYLSNEVEELIKKATE